MSVRRRNIRQRVERERRLALDSAEQGRCLARMKRVLDDAQSAGLKSLTQAEFWQRYHALEDAV